MRLIEAICSKKFLLILQGLQLPALKDHAAVHIITVLIKASKNEYFHADVEHSIT